MASGSELPTVLQSLPVIGAIARWAQAGEGRAEKWARSLAASLLMLVPAGVGWGYSVEGRLAGQERQDRQQAERMDRLEGRIEAKLDALDTRSRHTASTVRSIRDHLQGVYEENEP